MAIRINLNAHHTFKYTMKSMYDFSFYFTMALPCFGDKIQTNVLVFM